MKAKEAIKGIALVSGIFAGSVLAGFTYQSIIEGFTGNVFLVDAGLACAAVAVIGVAIKKQVKLLQIERNGVISRWCARLRRAADIRKAERVLQEAERDSRRLQLWDADGLGSKVVHFRYRVAAKDADPVMGRDRVVFR